MPESPEDDGSPPPRVPRGPRAPRESRHRHRGVCMNVVLVGAGMLPIPPVVARQIDRPTRVVPNGVDVAKYAPRWDARTGRRAAGVGEVAPHKQWHVAAEAARAAGAELRIAGPVRDVPYAKRVEAAGATLLGAVSEDELTALLAESDVLLHPSVSESFGMAVVEGMSAGLPVICSSLLSFLVTEGVEGYHIPTDASDEARVAAASDRLRALLADAALRRRVGEAARGKALASYSWEAVAAQ